MSDSKDKVDPGVPPAYTVTQPAEGKENEKTTRRKYAISGVVIVTLVTLVTGGVLCGVYLQNRFTRQIIQDCCTVDIKNATGSKVGELKVDAEKNQQEYKALDGSLTVLYDFNKEIAIFVTGTKCYLKSLNTTNMLHPRNIKKEIESGNAVSGKLDDDSKTLPEISYVPGQEPVADHDFLGQKARDHCKGKEMYRLIPSLDRHPRGWIRRSIRRVRLRVRVRVRARVRVRRGRVRARARARVRFWGR